MLEIRIMVMEQLLVTASSRGRCNGDIGTACWRQGEVEIERWYWMDLCTWVLKCGRISKRMGSE